MYVPTKEHKHAWGTMSISCCLSHESKTGNQTDYSNACLTNFTGMGKMIESSFCIHKADNLKSKVHTPSCRHSTSCLLPASSALLRES